MKDLLILAKCLSKDFWEQHSDYLNRELFHEDAGILYDIIVYLHSTDTRPTERIVKEYLFDNYIFSNKKKHYFSGLISDLFSVDVSEELAADFLDRLYARKTAQKVMDCAIKVANGETSLDELKALLNFEYKTDDSISPVTTDLDDLFGTFSREDAYKLSPDFLQEKLAGIYKGEFALVLARPETGKSSFIAQNNIGFLRQGLKVLVFANEEPGKRIVVNHIRSCCNMSSDEILQQKSRSFLAEWESIRDRLIVIDVHGLTMPQIDAIVGKYEPDVVVIDQLDKIKPEGKSASRTEMLMGLYTSARDMAIARQVALIGVCQASAEVEDKFVITYADADYSKTHKGAELDLCIGIGRRSADDDGTRCFYVSKNKTNGWRGELYCKLDSERCNYIR